MHNDAIIKRIIKNATVRHNLRRPFFIGIIQIRLYKQRILNIKEQQDNPFPTSLHASKNKEHNRYGFLHPRRLSKLYNNPLNLLRLTK